MNEKSGVTESKAGTMPDTEGQAKVTPSKEGKTPPSASKVSPEDAPKFTQKEFDAGVHEAESKAGRAIKALEVREKTVLGAEVKETERQKARDVKELEAAKDDSEQLTIVQQRIKLRDRETELNRRAEEHEASKATHQAEIEEARATRLETDVWGIATKHKVDPTQLKKAAAEVGITDLKQIEGLAKAMSTAKPFVPDDGKTTGGGEITEQQRLDKLYPTMAKKS